MNYNKINSPLSIGAVKVPNRIVMGAMHTRLETLDRPLERQAAFYAARARGGVGLILTGGYSPTQDGIMEEGAPCLYHEDHLAEHQFITSEVRKAGGRIILQILHAGRYAKVATCVAPSPGQARINPFPPRELSTAEVWDLVTRFVTTAKLAQKAGYDGVEIMGSEGYLLNEFTAAATNHREDEFGGSLENRIRFPLEILRAIREAVGLEFAVIYRISAIDLVNDGMTALEVTSYARAVESAGADAINTGIGWHESTVPTIAASVPRAAWLKAIRNVKNAVSIPVIASNRINTPDVAEEIVSSGTADLVSMARPLLADPDFALKTRAGKAEEINTCIACNQACLDRIFTERTATCLVNPKAGREVEFITIKPSRTKNIAVIGGGPAGMSFSVNAAERGHRITLFESAPVLGGQLNMARVVPGKSEFDELLRYFRVMLEKHDVELRLGKRVSAKDLIAQGFDEVVLATGVVPRIPEIDGVNHPKVLSYIDVLAGSASVGESVAIIGAGGIGFDVAEYLLGDPQESTDVSTFDRFWGIDPQGENPGWLAEPVHTAPKRKIFMFQRKAERLGKNLGKSTGWILKAKLRKAGVVMTPGVTYEAIDSQGLHFSKDGQAHLCEVDNVVLCSGQISNRDLYAELQESGLNVHLIGGADVASELDALRAIDQATRLAFEI